MLTIIRGSFSELVKVLYSDRAIEDHGSLQETDEEKASAPRMLQRDFGRISSLMPDAATVDVYEKHCLEVCTNYRQGILTGRFFSPSCSPLFRDPNIFLRDIPLYLLVELETVRNPNLFRDLELNHNNISFVYLNNKDQAAGFTVYYRKDFPDIFFIVHVDNAAASVDEREVTLIASEALFFPLKTVEEKNDTLRELSDEFGMACSREFDTSFFSKIIHHDGIAKLFSMLFGAEEVCVPVMESFLAERAGEHGQVVTSPFDLDKFIRKNGSKAVQYSGEKISCSDSYRLAFDRLTFSQALAASVSALDIKHTKELIDSNSSVYQFIGNCLLAYHAALTFNKAAFNFLSVHMPLLECVTSNLEKGEFSRLVATFCHGIKVALAWHLDQDCRTTFCDSTATIKNALRGKQPPIKPAVVILGAAGGGVIEMHEIPELEEEQKVLPSTKKLGGPAGA